MSSSVAHTSSPNNLDALWKPFTANRQFKSNPRMLVGAKGMYYTSHDGRQVLDGTAGLWCVNAGHCNDHIVSAVQTQVARMDYSKAFQMGHPAEFELAARLVATTPGDLDHVFFGLLLTKYNVGANHLFFLEESIGMPDRFAGHH